MPAPIPEPAPPLPPDFRHVESWVFDLDHTLYTIDAVGRAAMSDRIGRYVQRHLGLEPEPAHAIQKQYLRDYGSTLGGLIRHHGVDPDHYHDFVNDIEAMGLAPDARLRAGLARLAGRRIVFTNNCGRYAAEVLERLTIADLFADIIDARAMGFVPKPNREGYDIVVARGAVPARAAMFDDSARNLAPAHALGMTTVWLKDSPAHAPADWALLNAAHIHYETSDLADFLHTIRI